MARYKRKYIKTSYCKYCGKRTYGTPFCTSCSKKYFNFELKHSNIYNQSKPTKKLSSWDWRESTSEYADRVDRLLNGGRKKDSAWIPPSIPEHIYNSNFMGEPDETIYISKHDNVLEKDWERLRKRLDKKMEKYKK